jgi:hypothetical protein
MEKETDRPVLETPETNRVLGPETHVTLLSNGECLEEQFIAQDLSEEKADFAKLDEFDLLVSSA